MSEQATNSAAPERVLNWANAFTFLRVLLVPVIGWLMWEAGSAEGSLTESSVSEGSVTTRWWAFGIFVFAAWTDSVDGWLARRLSGPTRLGALADPLADKLLIIGALAILAWLGQLPWWAVLVVVAREVLVTWQRARLLAEIDVVMSASPWGKIKTVTQIVAVSLYLYPGIPALLRTGGLWVAVIATVLSGLEYAGRIRRIRADHASGISRGGNESASE